MISKWKEFYFTKFDVDLERAKKRALVKNENGMITAATEMCGEKYIKESHLFDLLFPDNIGWKKVTSKKLQKSGADYEIYFEYNDSFSSLYIDIKVCIGPNYNMSSDDYNQPTRLCQPVKKGVPVEIYQNDIFTFSKGKLTDYVLYIIMDEDGIFYKLFSYDEIRKICLEHKKEFDLRGGTATIVNKGKYKWHKSNNGSGIYIKIPITNKNSPLS